MQQESSLSSASLNFQLKSVGSGAGGGDKGSRRLKNRLHTSAGLSRMRPTLSLSFCLVLCLALGLACVMLACLWSSRFRGGFRWDGSALQFNWHPVLMTSGLVVTYGFASVLYRVPLTWGQSKLPWKLLHSALMLVALLLSVVGLCAAFDFHNKNRIPNLYSIHSWVGLSCVVLFAFQWVAGLSVFLLPCSPVTLRKLLKPLHVWLGRSILVLSIAACISGINEKLLFVLKGANHTVPYSRLPPEALFANSLGIVIIVFGLVVHWILTNDHWQRPDNQTQDAAYTPLSQEERD